MSMLSKPISQIKNAWDITHGMMHFTGLAIVEVPFVAAFGLGKRAVERVQEKLNRGDSVTELDSGTSPFTAADAEKLRADYSNELGAIWTLAAQYGKIFGDSFEGPTSADSHATVTIRIDGDVAKARREIPDKISGFDVKIEQAHSARLL